MRILNILQRHSRFGENVDAFVDGELAPADARRFEAHLLGCEECSAAVAAAQDLKTMVAALPESPAPRSFRLTPEMVAAAPPAVVQRRAPAYVGLVRAGAALSVAAFATVLAAGLVRSGGDSDSAAFRELSTNTELQDTAFGTAPEEPSDKAAEPTPQLAPASNGGVSVSGMATATAASSQPLAPSAIAATPATGGDSASRAAEDSGDDDGAESAIGYSAEDATTEGEGPGTATVALGLFAAAMLLLLGAVEVTRRTRRA